MSVSRCSCLLVLCCGFAGCPPAAQEDQSGGGGEVEIGTAVQVVPLLEDTNLFLWETCNCPPLLTIPPGSGQSSCSTPNELQNKARINFQLSAPEETEAFALMSCPLVLPFLVEDTGAGVSSGNARLICNFSHTGTVDAYNYQLFIAVSLRGESGEIDRREFRFCEAFLASGVGIVGACAEPYEAGTEQIEFSHNFQAGNTYVLSVEVSSNVSALPTESTWGGQILFGLEVDSVRVVF